MSSFDSGDGDGALTEAGTKGVFERWKKDWDGNADGVLSMDELGAGFGKIVPPPPGFPGGGGGPGGPGREAGERIRP